jgi:hypothetical protein
MHEAGQIGTLRRLQLTLVEGRQAVAFFGEVKLRTKSATRSTRTNAITRVLERQDVGVQVRATARVGAGQKIDLDLELKESGLVPNATIVVAIDDNGLPIPTLDTVSATLKGKLSVVPGHALAVEGAKTMFKSAKEQTLIVITAKLGEPDDVLDRRIPPPGARRGPIQPPGN